MSLMVEFLFENVVDGIVALWPRKRRVPDVRGKNLEECRLAVEGADLELHVQPDATTRALVTSQHPNPRTRAKAGSPVVVTVGEP